MTDSQIKAQTLIAVYKQKLAEANDRMVMLQAMIIHLEDQVEELKNSLTELEESKTEE